jgi:hypothetical protein
MECLRLVNTWSISVTEFFGRITSPGQLASPIAKGRHRAPLREIGHYRPLFVVNPVEPAVPITGAILRGRQAPSTALSRAAIYAQKKTAPSGRGQFNREEVNRKNQHGLLVIAHVN